MIAYAEIVPMKEPNEHQRRLAPAEGSNEPRAPTYGLRLEHSPQWYASVALDAGRHLEYLVTPARKLLTGAFR